MTRRRGFRRIDARYLDTVEFAVTDRRALIDRTSFELARVIRKTLLPGYREALAEIDRLRAELAAKQQTPADLTGTRHRVTFDTPKEGPR